MSSIDISLVLSSILFWMILYRTPKVPEELIETPKGIVSNESNSDELIGDVIGELIDDLPISSGNDDWKETAWQRKLRRQNRARFSRKRR